MTNSMYDFTPAAVMNMTTQMLSRYTVTIISVSRFVIGPAAFPISFHERSFGFDTMTWESTMYEIVLVKPERKMADYRQV